MEAVTRCHLTTLALLLRLPMAAIPVLPTVPLHLALNLVLAQSLDRILTTKSHPPSPPIWRHQVPLLALTRIFLVLHPLLPRPPVLALARIHLVLTATVLDQRRPIPRLAVPLVLSTATALNPNLLVQRRLLLHLGQIPLVATMAVHCLDPNPLIQRHPVPTPVLSLAQTRTLLVHRRPAPFPLVLAAAKSRRRDRNPPLQHLLAPSRMPLAMAKPHRLDLNPLVQHRPVPVLLPPLLATMTTFQSLLVRLHLVPVPMLALALTRTLPV